MNVVLVMFKDNQRREFPITGEKTILGRRQDCHLRIPTGDVSRQHCALLVQKDAVIVKDLGSSNGTFVNGKRVTEVRLKPGDRLRLGPVTFIVQIDGQPTNISPQDIATPPVAEPEPLLEEDEETFELTEEDLELDDQLSASGEPDDEKDMP